MVGQKLYILKLGGSLLTDKQKPESIRYEILTRITQEIINTKEKLILIHGGGSFGHPLAKKYKIFDGLDRKVVDQTLGLSRTHYAMNKFNSLIIKSFLDNNFPVLPIQTSSSFIQDSRQTFSQAINIIEATLDLDIMPILYGDILLSMDGSFSIISGDQIIFLLCRDLKNYKVSKVIFAMDVDGIYIKGKKNEKDHKLAEIIHKKELNDLELVKMDRKIDVTGGIEGKIKAIETILEFEIPIQLINGLKEGYIYNSLKNYSINCTTILP
ncbi:MAG: isopentenyl phosphate kinase family protein [Promethearchaeota archaeon]|nr:MAG: isopentenyl phosphate kinase family protein [Candidatus Lokiarchaeota archaeon]